MSAFHPVAPQHHAFIAVEGVDGVGKSTFVRALAHRIGAQRYASPGGPFDGARPLVDRDLSPASRYYFFRAAVQHDGEQIAELLRTRSVVSDRYIDSTIVCHVARDATLSGLVSRAGIPVPHLTLVLTATPAVIAARLAARPTPGHEERDLSFVLRCDAAFRALGHPVLDTSVLSVDALVAHALEILTARCPKATLSPVLVPELP